jgi:uncharacterized BrkB/YihY/UPF0761 family membrane protein
VSDSGPAATPDAAAELTPAPPGKAKALPDRAKTLLAQLERRPLIGFGLRSFRRFGQIEGKHLALVIAANLFIAIIPLMILGYAILVAFNPNRSFAAVVIHTFHLSGSTADIVQNTFTSARSGRNTALSISFISLLITGFDISATIQQAYARSFDVTPLKGIRKLWRGGLWLVILLAESGGALTLRYLASSRPWWFLILVIPLYLGLQFGFLLVTPRLLLDLPFKWRDLMRGAAIGTAASVVVAVVSSFELRNWMRGYGHAYGGFGIGLAMMAYVGILALFWVWVAVIMGTYWEQQAGSTTVAAMQELSADAAAAD